MLDLLNKIKKELEDSYKETVDLRRHLHQYPELSFQEFETAKLIVETYNDLGVPIETKVGGNGIVAKIKGGKPGKTIALRADFDGLPIQDEKDISYKSKIDGVMHACGHDGHTATLLSIAKSIIPYQEELPGTIVLLHQHAEESAPGGAKPMIEAGCLEQVDAIFGTHLWTPTPLGVIETSKTALMAGVDRFEIIIKGEGGHGGMPHETKDATVIGSDLVSQLQQIVSRRIDPLSTAVVTVGVFESGKAYNIISGEAKIVGTVRYLDHDIQNQIVDEMEKMIKGICLSNNASYDFNYEKSYPPVINHEKGACSVLQAGQAVNGVDKVREINPVMAGEDFSYYLKEKPGAFFFTGAQKKGNFFPHHHPKFDFDERAMLIAAKTLVQIYFDYQEKNGFNS